MEGVHPYQLLEAEKRSYLLGETTLGLRDAEFCVGLKRAALGCASHTLQSHLYSQKPRRCVCLGPGKREPSKPSRLTLAQFDIICTQVKATADYI